MTSLLLLFSSMLVGWLLRRRKLPTPPPRALSAIVRAMLFAFGVAIGRRHEVVGQLGVYGLKSLVMALLTASVSALAAWGLWHLATSRRHRS